MAAVTGAAALALSACTFLGASPDAESSPTANASGKEPGGPDPRDLARNARRTELCGDDRGLSFAPSATRASSRRARRSTPSPIAHDLLGVGLDSAQTGYPPSSFNDVFVRAGENSASASSRRRPISSASKASIKASARSRSLRSCPDWPPSACRSRCAPCRMSRPGPQRRHTDPRLDGASRGRWPSQETRSTPGVSAPTVRRSRCTADSDDVLNRSAIPTVSSRATTRLPRPTSCDSASPGQRSSSTAPPKACGGARSTQPYLLDLAQTQIKWR